MVKRCLLFCFILFLYNCEWNIISQKGLTTIIRVPNNSKWIKYQTLYQIYNRDYWYECWIIHSEICSIWFSIQERHRKHHHVSLSLSLSPSLTSTYIIRIKCNLRDRIKILKIICGAFEKPHNNINSFIGQVTKTIFLSATDYFQWFFVVVIFINTYLVCRIATIS